MESLGTSVRRPSPTTIRAAGAFLPGVADARKGSFPGGELLGVDPEVSPGCVGRSPGSVLAGAVSERLGGCVQLLACDVGIAAHGREVCVAEDSATRRASPVAWRSHVAAVWRSVCAVTCFAIPARGLARRMMSARIAG